MTDREYMLMVDAARVAEKRGYTTVAAIIRQMLEREDAARQDMEVVAPF